MMFPPILVTDINLLDLVTLPLCNKLLPKMSNLQQQQKNAFDYIVSLS